MRLTGWLRSLPIGPARSANGACLETEFMTIAIWCILVAATLPYVAFSFVKGVDATKPRERLAGLDERSLRAYGAHLNGFETFPLFAAAVIVAHVVGGPSRAADLLAVLYILVRIGHMAAYLAGRQPLRSAAFGVAQLVAVAIFVSPLFR
jgi:uncharacterized MAPEG superfamily protein